MNEYKKIIVECRYDFVTNKIRYGKRGYIVTEENERYYYCENIGKTFYKKDEYKAIIKIGSGWADVVAWQSRKINNEYPETLHVNDMNTSLRYIIQEYLRERIDEIEIKSEA